MMGVSNYVGYTRASGIFSSSFLAANMAIFSKFWKTMRIMCSECYCYTFL